MFQSNAFQYIDLCKQTKEHALEVVTAFRTPANCLHAPIAGVPTDRAHWAYYPDPQPSAKSKL